VANIKQTQWEVILIVQYVKNVQLAKLTVLMHANHAKITKTLDVVHVQQDVHKTHIMQGGVWEMEAILIVLNVGQT